MQNSVSTIQLRLRQRRLERDAGAADLITGFSIELPVRFIARAPRRVPEPEGPRTSDTFEAYLERRRAHRGERRTILEFMTNA